MKKIKIIKKRVLAVILISGVMLGLFLFKPKEPNLQVVTVSSEIDEYNYTLESNTTRFYKKYYKELQKELSNTTIDEKNYATLVSKLFVIDYYTLDNKVTNMNIGGVQFIHSNLKDNFIINSTNSIYKHIKNNLYGNRNQELPEVNDVKIKTLKEIKYKNGNYQDNYGYEVVITVGYVKDYGYPKEVKLILIHEDKKLSIVEIKNLSN